jgi:hypothetical protein
MRLGSLLLSAVLFGLTLTAQVDDPGVVPAHPINPQQPVLSDERIFGVIPGYQFVEKPESKLPPLRSKDKFVLFVKETSDPFTIFGSVMGASYSHITQGDPHYGQGSEAYAQRVGAAYADVATQNFFADYLLATLFKEDPRYYRLGPKASVARRVGYSLSRVAVCRTDAGKNRICLSSILGTGMGIGLSNAYYPRADRTGSEMLSRAGTSFSAAAVTNLLPEFWPDIKAKFFPTHPKKSDPPPQPKN